MGWVPPLTVAVMEAADERVFTRLIAAAEDWLRERPADSLFNPIAEAPGLARVLSQQASGRAGRSERPGRALLQTFTEGLQCALRIEHAIVWLLDEAQQNLYTLAAIGYAQPNTGAELPVADLGEHWRHLMQDGGAELHGVGRSAS